MTAHKDYLASQGARAFGTRLRRLFEALNGGVSEAYATAGVDFEPRWFGLLTLLRDSQRVEIGMAAAALGQSHVAVVQVANALESRGLIRRIASKTDRRSRSLEITAKGRALCAKLAPLWEDVAAATAALLAEAAPHFMKELDALDEALAKRPFVQRIHARSRS
jgi:DNA-binding MarR family transcriptional regulator